jgi:glycosyltransferase involved in cell wall biosynthesis
LARILRDFHPNVIYSYMATANIIATTLGRRYTDCVVCGVRIGDLDWRSDGAFVHFQSLSELRLLRSANLVIANSHSAAHEPTKHRIRVIPILNGIDGNRFGSDPSGRLSIWATWGVSTDEELIGAVGRLDPVKGHDDLLAAFSEVLRHRPAARLAIVGREWDREYSSRLRLLANELNIEALVVWSRPHTDMPPVYSAFDIMVSASRREGMANVLLEAMACEIPCVATDVAESAAVVGSVGEIVPNRRPDQLAIAICRLLDRVKRDRVLGVQARKRVLTEFGVERLVQQTVEALCVACAA